MWREAVAMADAAARAVCRVARAHSLAVQVAMRLGEVVAAEMARRAAARVLLARAVTARAVAVGGAAVQVVV